MAADHLIGIETDLVPPEDSRCTTVLEDMLEGYAGIKEARYDIEESHLKVSYDPRILTPERAMYIVHQAGKNAGI
ncbi:MAG TPA: hypothetical protein PJ988_08685, partial [Anaerolinea sp.]|nr:hypothetical protein [Anaerolinea sp.]